MKTTIRTLKRWLLLIVSIGIFLLFIMLPTFAQTILQFEQQNGYTSNLFQNYKGIGSSLSTTSLDIGYTAFSHLTLLYKGNLNFFDTSLNADIQRHSGLLEYTTKFGRTSNWLRLGLMWDWQLSDEFSLDYEYSEPSVYFGWKYDLGTQSLLSAGLRYRKHTYLYADEYSFRESFGFGRWNRSFNTGTSYQIELGFGRKEYTLQTIDDTVVPSQISWRFRVAQSLFSNVGLWAQWSARRLLEPDSRYLITDDSYLLDEGFDDIYHFHTSQWQMGFHWVIRPRWQLKTNLSYATNNYPHRPIFDLYGEILSDSLERRDQSVSLGIALDGSMPLPLSSSSLPFILRYDYSHHLSNDEYYDFSQHTISMGWKLGF
ncbi:hypothetical protein H8E77_22415 [bacterium]|nr:hypothetical protein [bacterium]